MRLDSLSFKIPDQPGKPATITVCINDRVEVEAKLQRGYEMRTFTARIVSIDTVNKTITLDSSTNQYACQESYEFDNVRTMRKVQ